MGAFDKWWKREKEIREYIDSVDKVIEKYKEMYPEELGSFSEMPDSKEVKESEEEKND